MNYNTAKDYNNMSNPLISVIIPAFNSEKYIVKCLKSVYSQTYKNIEVILIDDGSTDRTSEIVRSQFPEVKLIDKDNGGVSSARNVGIINSTGTFLAFLDSDDSWLPDKLMLQHKFASKHSGISAFYCNVIDMNEDKPQNQRINAYQSFGVDKEFYEITDYIRPEKRLFFNVQSTLFVRREIFDLHGLYDESLQGVEDSDLVLRWGLAGLHFGYINIPLAHYQVGNPDSLTKNLTSWSKHHFRYWAEAPAKYKVTDPMLEKFLIMRRKSLEHAVYISLLGNNKPWLAFKRILENIYVFRLIDLPLLLFNTFPPIFYFKKLLIIIFVRK